jgi:hypothetical protein
MADRVYPGRHVDIAARPLRRARRPPLCVIDGVRRVLRKGVQNIGQQQFLMLLLVMQADLDDLEYAPGICGRRLRDKTLDGAIHVRTIGCHIIAIRPCDQSALRTRMARTCRDIIRVEQKRESLVEDPVRGIVRHQQKLLEKPGDMRAMPLGGAGIRHRLNDLVFGRETGRAPFRLRPHAAELCKPRCARVVEGTLRLCRPFMQGRRHSCPCHGKPP